MTKRFKNPARLKRVAMVVLFLALSVLWFHGTALAQYRAFGGRGGTSGPNLTATMKTINAGSLTIGSTAYVVVIFKNDGVSPVEVGKINLYPSSTVSTAVSLDQCSAEPLPPGAECAITLAVSGLQVGSFRIEMLVNHNGHSRLATTSITGMVEGVGDAQQTVQTELEAYPDMLDFGNVISGIEQIRSITFRNKTSETLNIDDIHLEAPQKSGYSFESNCTSLKPGEACLVTVSWSPIVRGETLASLVVEHDGLTSVTRLNVVGEYSPTAPDDATLYPSAISNAGLLITDRSQFDFGSDVKSMSAITASLVNVGDRNLTLTDIRFSSSDNGLSIGRDGCQEGLVLPPNAACGLTLTWVPTRSGPILDDVQIHHTGARGILVIPVRGDAKSAVLRGAVSFKTSQGEVQNRYIPNFDGYAVTSLSPDTGVLSSPVGTLMVRDGEETVIGGISWYVDISDLGIQLSRGTESIMLVFDRSLTPNRFEDASKEEDSESSSSDE